MCMGKPYRTYVQNLLKKCLSFSTLCLQMGSTYSLLWCRCSGTIYTLTVEGYRSQLHYVAVGDLGSQVLSQSVPLYFCSQTNTGLVAKIKETTSTSFSNINLSLAQQFDMLFSVGFCLFLWSKFLRFLYFFASEATFFPCVPKGPLEK